MRPRTRTRSAGAILLSALMAALLVPSVAVAGNVPAEIDCIQPDGRIRKGAGAPVGNDIYNDTGAHQRRRGSAAPGSTISFRISIQNDDDPDSLATYRFLVKAEGTATSAYAVKYFRGSTDITNAVVAGTYRTSRLAAGETYLITARVKVKTSAPIGSQVTRLVTIGWSSWDADWCVDAVRFTGSRG